MDDGRGRYYTTNIKSLVLLYDYTTIEACFDHWYSVSSHWKHQYMPTLNQIKSHGTCAIPSSALGVPYVVNHLPDVVISKGIKCIQQLLFLFLGEVGKQRLSHTVRQQLG